MRHTLPLLLATACLLVTLCRAVFNGIPVSQGQFPYLVYIIINHGDPVNAYACGGGIISERYVISAGHCSFGGNFRVILDTLDVNGYSSSKVVRVTDVQRPIDFGTFNGEAMFDYNDVAIFTLERNVSEVAGKIEYLAVTTTSPPVGSKLTVVGYGMLATNLGTSKAHWGTITVAEDEQCRFDSYKPEVSFCTVDTEYYTCPGDSGSPIIFKPPGYNRFVAVGLNSYGHEGACGSKEPDSVMTKLAAMTNFISQKTTLAPPTFVNVVYPQVSTTPSPTPSCFTPLQDLFTGGSTIWMRQQTETNVNASGGLVLQQLPEL